MQAIADHLRQQQLQQVAARASDVHGLNILGGETIGKARRCRPAGQQRNLRLGRDNLVFYAVDFLVCLTMWTADMLAAVGGQSNDFQNAVVAFAKYGNALAVPKTFDRQSKLD